MLSLRTEQLLKSAVIDKLFRALRALFRNKHAAPAHGNAVLRCELTLLELCALRMEWDVDGSVLERSWAHLPEEDRVRAQVDFFGKFINDIF